MSINLLKRAPVALAATALSASLFAGPDMETRLQYLEQQMKQVRTETATGTFGAKTASARPEVDGKGVFVSVDALLWHAKVGGTEYAYTDNNTLASFPVQGSTKELDFDWSWGFRFGLGYNFAHDSWDALLNYTYFKSNDSSKVDGGGNGAVVPLQGNANLTVVDFGAPFVYGTYASSQFKFSYDNLDLELGRSYFISGSLCFRPFFGIRNTWLDLAQNTTYSGGAILGVNSFKVNNTNDFWGIGPRAGMDSKWYLANGFSIFGNLSGSLLWGYFKVEHQENVTNNPQQNSIDLTANMHRFAPNAQLCIGLAYDRYVYNDKQHIGLSLGWENIYYWRVNQMLEVIDSSTSKYERISEDASMQGVTFHLRWDF